MSAAAAHEAGQAAAAHAPLVPELPNLVTILHHLFEHHPVLGPVVRFLHQWENAFFAGLVILCWSVVAWLVARRPQWIPSRPQAFVETIIEGLDSFVASMLGPHGRAHTPFIGTLFIYIFTMNVIGMVPGLKSPTSNLNTTAGLALCVFAYVQYQGIRLNGLKQYLLHFVGEPWFLAPINIPIHLVGEIAKPASLALRLFGNITGEDVLLFIFVSLGLALGTAVVHGAPFGAPLHILFYPLVILFSSIQALVFSLLTTVYISMVLPHEAHH